MYAKSVGPVLRTLASEQSSRGCSGKCRVPLILRVNLADGECTQNHASRFAYIGIGAKRPRMFGGMVRSPNTARESGRWRMYAKPRFPFCVHSRPSGLAVEAQPVLVELPAEL